jgi:abequosyltransferase
MRFSICIPAYNRARHLDALLSSIIEQDFKDFEIVICEDVSPERAQIAAIAHRFDGEHPGVLRYIENQFNHGYDANIRELAEQARGEYCFFMGNDDIMCAGALSYVDDVIRRHGPLGVIVKSYAWFDGDLQHMNQEVRYFAEERLFAAGADAVSVTFRRSGVISGYIVNRAAAQAAATEKYDGTLYYQMHLTTAASVQLPVIFVPKILVLCRNGEAPDFGHSAKEKGKYTPGGYTPEARLNMVGGALRIAREAEASYGVCVYDRIVKDYASYFYPYIKDQLNLSPIKYLELCRRYAEMGFGRYPIFYIYCLMAYMLKEGGFDCLTRLVRKMLGRSPQIGI